MKFMIWEHILWGSASQEIDITMTTVGGFVFDLDDDTSTELSIENLKTWPFPPSSIPEINYGAGAAAASLC